MVTIVVLDKGAASETISPTVVIHPNKFQERFKLQSPIQSLVTYIHVLMVTIVVLDIDAAP